MPTEQCVFLILYILWYIVHVQYTSKKTSHKRTVQRAPVLIKRGENGSARSNGCVYRVGNVEDQRYCCVFSGLGVLKQA